MAVDLYNSLTRQKERFEPARGSTVTFYQCGPTVYDSSHIGHCRPLIVYDAMIQFFRYYGWDVIHVENFTDVDDKIIDRAGQRGEQPSELSSRYTREYLTLVDELGAERASVYPRVSEHIGEIITLVQDLVDGGYAYAVDGDVFFDVQSFDDYGKLSGRKLEDLQSGSRIEVDERKRHPADFAVWKAAKGGEISWPSPWGPGRPGWHIECSAMSLKYLGYGFDIHGGGSDLVFPHHENEIAQSEAASGKLFSRFWLHTGMLNIDSEKMSKSLGNFVVAREVLADWGAHVVRLFMLRSHYRKPLDYNPGQLEEARASWQRLRQMQRTFLDFLGEHEPDLQAIAAGGPAGDQARRLVEAASELDAVLDADELDPQARAAWQAGRELEAAFLAAMEDDLNTASAIGALFDYTHQLNQLLADAGSGAGATGWQAWQSSYLRLAAVSTVFGLLPLSRQGSSSGLADELVDFLLSVRTAAREQKQFQLADDIRDGLVERGIIVEDTAQGPRWHQAE